MTQRYTIRSDSAANWAAANPILAVGEIGWSTDTLTGRVGDGSSLYLALPVVFRGANAGLDSPQFTGTPTAPTPPVGTNNTTIATTAYVLAAIAASGGGGGGGGSAPDATTLSKGIVQLAGDLGGTAASPTVPGLAGKAPLASPALTGTPTAPTPALNTNTMQVATAAMVTAASKVIAGTNVQGVPYTLQLIDAGFALEITASGATNVTVPPNSSVPFPIGTIIEVLQYGTGQITIVAGTNVTVQTASSYTSRAQYSTLSLRKRATDEWILAGDVT